MPDNATVSGIPIPAEALNEGTRGGANEGPAPEQRKPDGAPLVSGPVRGELDSYKPASYKTARGFVRTDR
jgi:hypothetical protein